MTSGSGRDDDPTLEPEDDPPTARQAPPRVPYDDAGEEEDLGAAFQDEIPTAYEESTVGASPQPPTPEEYRDPYANALARGGADGEFDPSLFPVAPLPPDEQGQGEYPDAVSTVSLGSEQQPEPDVPDLDDEVETLAAPAPSETTDVEEVSADLRQRAEGALGDEDSDSGLLQDDVPTLRPVGKDAIDTSSFEPEASQTGLISEELQGRSPSFDGVPAQGTLEPGRSDLLAAAADAEADHRDLARDTTSFETASLEMDDDEDDDGPTLMGSLGDYVGAGATEQDDDEDEDEYGDESDDGPTLMGSLGDYVGAGAEEQDDDEGDDGDDGPTLVGSLADYVGASAEEQDDESAADDEPGVPFDPAPTVAEETGGAGGHAVPVGFAVPPPTTATGQAPPAAPAPPPPPPPPPTESTQARTVAEPFPTRRDQSPRHPAQEEELDEGARESAETEPPGSSADPDDPSILRPGGSVDLAKWSQHSFEDSEDTGAYDETAIASLEDTSELDPPSFELAVPIVEEEDPEQARRLSTAVASRLRTGVTSITSVRSGEVAEVSEEHKDLDPRPFLESLRRNPGDKAAFSALHRIYTASEQWEELVGLLLEQSEAERVLSRRLELLCELGEVLAEQLGEPEKAQVALVSAVLLEPRSDAAAEKLEVVTSRAGLWQGLFGELGQAAAQEAHAGRRAALCGRMGEWYVQAGHTSYARPCFEQALAANQGELRALVGLAVIFEQTGEAELLGEVMARLPVALPPGVAPELLMRLASLQERHGHDQAAAAALDGVLEGDPSAEDALEALERVLGRQGRFDQLADRLATRAEQVQVVDPDGAAELWRRVARLQMEQVGDLRVAEKACRAAMDLDGPDRQGLETLESIYSQASRWPELAWVLEQQLEIATSSREQVALLGRLAQMDEEEFIKPEAAIERWEKVLELDPRNEHAHLRVCENLRRLSRWPELVEAFERRAAASQDDPSRAACFTAAAKILHTELEDVERAVLHLQRSRKLDPRNVVAAELLAEVLEGTGDAEGAFAAYREVAAAHPDQGASAKALIHAADIAKDRLGRTEEAVELLEQAVALDPSQRDASARIRKERVAAGDWDGAARAIEAELDQAPASQRAKLLVELGAILHDKLGRDLDAVSVYEEARQGLGDTREVVAPLFELYLEADRKEDAAALSDALVRTAPKEDPAAVADEAVRAAEVLSAVGQVEGALSMLERGLKGAPDHGGALELLAGLSERADKWDEALSALGRLDAARGGETAPDLSVRIGRAARMCGQQEEARRRFEEVLARDPASNEALRQLSAIAQGAGDHGRALDLLGRVDVSDPEIRFGHLGRLAALAKDAGDDERLVGALRNALEIKPDDRKSLTMLLEAVSRLGDWSTAVETIEKLADSARSDDDKRARAKYLSAAAVVLRDKLGDLEAATAMYETVLDEDWTDLAVFEAIDKMLTGAREYRLQEQVYRRMIHRVSGKGRPEVEVQLWHALGEIYRSRLHMFEEAVEAFSAAARLDPKNPQRLMILAELCGALGKNDETVAWHKELLRLEPSRVESLQAIREVYSATGQYDRAFSVVSALAAHGQASPAELEFFEQWLPRPMVAAQAALDDESWIARLRHADEDPYVSGIFNAILAFAVAQKVRPAKEFGLGAATAVDFARSGGGVLAQQYLAVARVLGVVTPQLHVVKEQAATMAYALTDPPVSIFGGLVTQVGDSERVFLMARHLAYYQGGRYMAVAYPSRTELVAVLLSAVAAISGQNGAVPPTAKPFLDKLRGWLRQNPHVAERLTDLVRRFLERGGKVDIEAWLRGTEMTACRAGVLLVADPRAAAQGLRVDPSSPANVPPKERIDDLVSFVASDEYIALRQTIGVRVG